MRRLLLDASPEFNTPWLAGASVTGELTKAFSFPTQQGSGNNSGPRQAPTWPWGLGPSSGGCEDPRLRPVERPACWKGHLGGLWT